jgi:transposase InsO family protein
VHHSDRGSQYVSIKYTERLADVGIESSAGSVGDSYDNALAETINSIGPSGFTEAFLRGRGCRYPRNGSTDSTIAGLMGPIGEAEQRFYASLESPVLVA